MTTKGLDYSFSGGSLKPTELRQLLNHSYLYDAKKSPASIEGFEVDRSLSGKRAQVYRNPATGQVVVAHRGTAGLHDWITDLRLVTTGTARGSARFKHADKIQKQAEAKYGSDNVTTIGHSLGAQLATDTGSKSREIITLNKPVLPLDTVTGQHANQWNVRTQNDPVSFLDRYRANQPRERNVVIPSRSRSLLTEHRSDVLGRLSPDLEIGRKR